MSQPNQNNLQFGGFDGIMPEGSERLADGNIRLADGRLILPNGNIRLLDGSEQPYLPHPVNPPQPTQEPSEMTQLLTVLTRLLEQNATLVERSNTPKPPTHYYNVLPDLSHNIPKFDGLSIGLWSRELSTAVMGRSYFDVDDLLRYIVDFETLERARKQRINMNREKPKGQGDHRKMSTYAESRGTSQSSSSHQGAATLTASRSSDKDKYERECYRCHEKGHIARDCRIKPKIKCFNCNEIGHISVNCTKPKVIPEAEANLIIPNDNEISYRKYEKIVTVGHFKIKAFIDPGSSDCLIKESIVSSKGFHLIKLPSRIEGFGITKI